MTDELSHDSAVPAAPAPIEAPRYGQYAPGGPGFEAPPPPPPPPGWGGVPHPPPLPPSGTDWAPAPKPGLIPLRPLSFGTLLGAPFQVLRRNPGPTFGSALIIQFALTIVSLLFVGGALLFAFTRGSTAGEADQRAIDAGSTAIILLSTLIPLALGLVTTSLLQSILVIEVSREMLGEKRRMGELWRAARKRLWPLVLWILLEVVVIAVAVALIIGVTALLSLLGNVGLTIGIVLAVLLSLGLVVVAIWIGTKVSLVPCAIVLEGLPLRRAIARSWRLTDRSFWKTLGTLALVNVILSVATQVISFPVTFLFTIGYSILLPNGSPTDSTGAGEITFIVVLYGALAIVQLVFGAIGAVVQAATISVIYVDLRIRKEGLDLELVRYVEARQAGQNTEGFDPFQVPGTA